MSKRFGNVSAVLSNGAPIEDLRLGRSQSRALDKASGEVNGVSKQDIISAIAGMVAEASSGNITQHSPAEASAARRALLAEALADQSGQQWAALGSGLAEEITEQADREGFLRRISQGQTLRQGEVPRVPMPSHTAQAVVATSSSSVGYQTIRQRVFTPDEFEIIANVRVESLDLEQVNGDLLDKAYNQGLESIMVAEDRLWKTAADATVGTINNLEYISGELTTRNLANLRQGVARWNVPVTTALIANDYWADITGSNDFATKMDPITKYDLITNGQLSGLLGMTFITDAFRQQNQKVLNAGDLYVVSDAQNHAAYSTRGGVRSTPTNGANEGNTSRGWQLANPFSFVLANARSVVKGKRT